MGSPKILLLQGPCRGLNFEQGSEDPAMQALMGGMGSGVRCRLCQVEGEGQLQSGGDQAVWPLVGGIMVIVGLYSQRGCLVSLSPRLVGVGLVGWGRAQCQVSLVCAVGLQVLVRFIRLWCWDVPSIMEGCIGLLCCCLHQGVSGFSSGPGALFSAASVRRGDGLRGWDL